MHGRVAFLPNVRVSLKTARKQVLPISPQTVGDHIRLRRLQLGLSQPKLAAIIGVDPNTVLNWEKCYSPIKEAAHYGAVCLFLGYNPEPEPLTFGARMRWKRREIGWRAEDVARYLQIDIATLRQWELRTKWPRYRRYQDLVVLC